MNHTYTSTRSPIVSLAMAGVLETLSVLRASALPFASLPPVVGSNSVRFSDFQGLKIQPIRASVKLSSTQKLARRGSRIICEAQETDIQVQGLQVLYTSLNSPSLLTGWKSSGGDPCGESWKGITCQGSSIVAVQILGWDSMEQWDTCLTTLRRLRHWI